MYKDYFGLKDEPFRMTPDTRYLFKSNRYEEALASLLYGIKERKGFIVITGEIGTGKTTLCRSLLNQLGSDTKTAVILNPSLNKSELLHAIIDDLNIDMKIKNTSQKVLLDTLNLFLISEARLGNPVAVIIDEAQNLEPEVLESIRMLSNLETEQEKLLQIILVGQPELNEILKLPKMEQLRQRIAVRYHITPLERGEILNYIKHRLDVAGNENCVEFQPSAIEAIARYTRGTPRLINIICDKCMLAAYACKTKVIDGELALKAIMDHEGPASGSEGLSEQALGNVLCEDKTEATDYARVKRANLKSAVAAALIACVVLLIGIGTRKTQQPLNTANENKNEIATDVQEKILETAPAENKTDEVLNEVLRIWGVKSDGAKTIESAGMTGIKIVTNLSTLSKIGLPALIDDEAGPRLLIGASPTSFEFFDSKLDSTQFPNRVFKVARISENESILVSAVIPLPSHLALPANPAADPRVSEFLSAAMNRTRGLVRSDPSNVILFQKSIGIPADGIVGPLTWCALVKRSNHDFPGLTK